MTRTTEEETRPDAPEQPATLEVRKVRPTRGPISGVDVDRHAERLDAVAGSEFVDDRIRLRE